VEILSAGQPLMNCFLISPHRQNLGWTFVASKRELFNEPN
jgi:hypothetical protein